MPHIHTKPGEIDRTASVFIVHVPSRRVLLRLHEKYGIWLPPGGHIENTQTAPEAAMAEAWEEVGLRIRLWDGNQRFMYQHEGYADILPPIGMNIHFISPEHRHEDHVYFATAETKEIIEPEGREKSGGCRWLTREEIECHEDLEERVRQYALEALRILAPL